MARQSILCLIGLLFVFDVTIAQVRVPESLKTVRNATCFWSYSVERVSTLHDSLYNYTIRVQLEQKDSNGKYGNPLRLKHVLIYCSFTENGYHKKIYSKQVGSQWVLNFRIHTNQSFPLNIIAVYNHQKRIMPLKLNEGTYPGEPD